MSAFFLILQYLKHYTSKSYTFIPLLIVFLRNNTILEEFQVYIGFSKVSSELKAMSKQDLMYRTKLHLRCRNMFICSLDYLFAVSNKIFVQILLSLKTFYFVRANTIVFFFLWEKKFQKLIRYLEVAELLFRWFNWKKLWRAGFLMN